MGRLMPSGDLSTRRADVLGSFQPPEQLESRSLLSVGFGPMPQATSTPEGYRHVVADFDGDGRNDVAALDLLNSKSVIFLRGRGDGTFDPAQVTPLNVRALSIAAGQIVAGGGAELVVVGGAGTPTLLDPRQGGYRVTYVRVLGFNGLSARLEVSSITTLASPPHGYGRPSNPIIGEFTGDGLPDIAFAPDIARSRIVVLGGDGHVLHPDRTIPIPTLVGRFGRDPEDPIGADLNGDGRTDIVAFTSVGFIALLNTPTGLSATIWPVGLSDMFAWQLADIDGDGKADAVNLWTPPAQERRNQPDRYVVVRAKHGNGDGTFGQVRTLSRILTGGALRDGAFPAVEEAAIVAGPDIDGDGRADIVYFRQAVSSDRTNTVVVNRAIALTGTPGGGWSAPHDVLPPYEASGDGVPLGIIIGVDVLADFNGDGKADLLDASFRELRVFLAVDA